MDIYSETMADLMDDEGTMSRPTPESEKEVVRLWRAWKTVHEMCRDRGYQLIDEEINISLDSFRSRFTNHGMPSRDKMTMSALPTSEMQEKYKPLPTRDRPDPETQCGSIWVEFSKESAMGIKQMRAFAQHIQGNNFHTGIIVTQQALTPSAYKIIAAVQPNVIETFMEQDLLVNITHHMLVPRHVMLSAEEKKQLLERYRLKESQLPRIQTGDPMAKYLGLRRGQVVKIIRTSQTAGRYATYRWAI